MYSPVRTSTLSRMDRVRVVARYPCIMIISHLDTLNPASCHRPVPSCTIFFCLALSHPPRQQLPPRRPASFTAVLQFNARDPRLGFFSSDRKRSRTEKSCVLAGRFSQKGKPFPAPSHRHEQFRAFGGRRSARKTVGLLFIVRPPRAIVARLAPRID